MKKQEIKETPTAFSFGDPEPALSRYINDYGPSQLTDNGDWYLPPVSLQGLARLLRSNAFHGPILEFKSNCVMRGFVASSALSRRVMHAAVTDFTVFANCYFQRVQQYNGTTTRLRHLPAINMRRLREPGQYGYLAQDGNLVRFRKGEVVHLKNYDVAQNIYGVPCYLGAIQSMLLNEDATLFRRRYYRNGAHMGYILYSSASGLSDEDQEALKNAVRKSKGVGNFRNLFLHVPNGGEKGVQILPVGDFATRDELSRVKSLSRDDIISAHRMPAALSSVIPDKNSNFGDIQKTDRVYEKNEIWPVRELLLDINNWIPQDKQVRFETTGEDDTS